VKILFFSLSFRSFSLKIDFSDLNMIVVESTRWADRTQANALVEAILQDKARQEQTRELKSFRYTKNQNLTPPLLERAANRI
jgi:hypothetical protein